MLAGLKHMEAGHLSSAMPCSCLLAWRIQLWGFFERTVFLPVHS